MKLLLDENGNRQEFIEVSINCNFIDRDYYASSFLNQAYSLLFSTLGLIDDNKEIKKALRIIQNEYKKSVDRGNYDY